ncbi:MAG: alpha-L-fucosidase [Marinilabiliaceae bacterium]
MKHLLILLMVFTLLPGHFTRAQEWEETPEEKEERLEWWRNDRFGMFIHWGLYALPARHEWVKMRERMTNDEYRKYFDQFNPDLYNPKEWARKAKEAGMKYIVLTAKHHEGFCLFDSEYTDYKATNTPAGRDLIKEFVEAVRAEGLKVGFYYSLIDWHHPEYTIDQIHPQRPDSDEEYKEMNEDRDMAIYREYLHNQVRELMTNYGKIDLLWLDYSFPGKHGKDQEDWHSKELMQRVRELQPHIIINDRLDLEDVPGGWDFITPEQFKVAEWPTIDGEKVPWETCQTFSGSWGYHRDEHSWKSKRQLLGLLIESVSKGGNLLLNVGPTGRGNFDHRADKALASIGEWMKYHDKAIYGCTQAPEKFETPKHSLLTYNPETNRLYIHLMEYPLENFRLAGYKDKVKYARFLHDASEIEFSAPTGHWHRDELGENDLNLVLPVTKPDVEIPVIELLLKE